MPFLVPAEIEKSYYSFAEYNSKPRILTYWHQLNEALKLQPNTILEIGIGSGLVKSYFNHCGIDTKTGDINVDLNPDYHLSILDDAEVGKIGKFDLVMCSRVLHHIHFSELEKALINLKNLSNKNVILTLPVDELRIYSMFRYTSSEIKTISIKLPKFIKNIIKKSIKKELGSGLWQIDSEKKTSKNNVKKLINKHFNIVKSFQIPEDSSHMFYVLEVSK
jgi:hypothetical protein